MLYFVAIAIVVLDQLSKALIRSVIPVGESIPVLPGIFHITHVHNPGAAFGIFPNSQWIFLSVSIAVIAFILYYYRQVGRLNRTIAVSLGLVLGGAVGNLIDRIVAGRVTDFLDFRFWPVFNIADSAIVVGVILLSVILLSGTREERVEAN